MLSGSSYDGRSAKDLLNAEEAKVVTRTANTFESRVRTQLSEVDKTIDGLRLVENLEIFPMNERQLERSLEIGFLDIAGLKAFDHAILAAVLGRSEEIRSTDPGVELCFCELDSDLQPWFKKDGKRRSDLCDLYMIRAASGCMAISK